MYIIIDISHNRKFIVSRRKASDSVLFSAKCRRNNSTSSPGPQQTSSGSVRTSQLCHSHRYSSRVYPTSSLGEISKVWRPQVPAKEQHSLCQFFKNSGKNFSFFACVFAPIRWLAFQIPGQFEAPGAEMGEMHCYYWWPGG